MTQGIAEVISKTSFNIKMTNWLVKHDQISEVVMVVYRMTAPTPRVDPSDTFSQKQVTETRDNEEATQIYMPLSLKSSLLSGITK